MEKTDHIIMILKFINTWRHQQNSPQFADNIFKCIFFNENYDTLIQISLKIIPKGVIDNMPPLFQVMAWCRLGDRPLLESVMIQIHDTYL